MSFVPAIVDYSNRQIDIELLQSIAKPTALQRVNVTNVGETPKIVTGIEKAVQRYANLLLSTINDIHFDQTRGGTLLRSIMQGTVSNKGYLIHLFGITNGSVLRMLSKDDNDTRFGTIPDDEAIIGATLNDASVDYSTGTIMLEVLLTTQAGDSFSFIIPVSTAR